MNTIQTVFLFGLCLSFGMSMEDCSNVRDDGEQHYPCVHVEMLQQFRSMILCALPDSWPIWQFADYGCYCGPGGSGTPVDDLDRCCQVHDQCYTDAMQLPDCSFWEHPYIEIYHYECDEKNRKVTCDGANDKCEKFICECDRKAAECFSQSTWNREHWRLPSDQCKEES